MPVTLKQIITELEGIQQRRRETYRVLVLRGQMNHYTRDSKLAVLDLLIDKCKSAKKKKTLLKDELKDLPQ